VFRRMREISTYTAACKYYSEGNGIWRKERLEMGLTAEERLAYEIAEFGYLQNAFFITESSTPALLCCCRPTSSPHISCAANPYLSPPLSSSHPES
jgi:hypothetical protein